MERNHVQSVLLKEVVSSWNVFPKFCYLRDTLGARGMEEVSRRYQGGSRRYRPGGMEEAARARVRCAWTKFKELSPILTARGASYHIKGKIYRASVQNVLSYRTETWAMKKENLPTLESSLERSSLEEE